MTMQHAGLAEVVRRNPRYAYEAYEFVFAALAHTQRMLGRQPSAGAGEDEAPHHVSGRELLEGVRDLALQEFGRMARVVLHLWGIDRTDDVGEIVFNLVESRLMSKTDEDRREDFRDVFDLDQALLASYVIRLPEGDEP